MINVSKFRIFPAFHNFTNLKAVILIDGIKDHVYDVYLFKSALKGKFRSSHFLFFSSVPLVNQIWEAFQHYVYLF